MNFRHWLKAVALVALAAPAHALLTTVNDVDFGTTGSVQPVTQALFVVNDTTFALRLTGINITGGPPSRDFTVAASSTCARETTLEPDERCRLDLTFRPTTSCLRDASLKIYTDIDLVPAEVDLSGTGVKVETAKDLYPALVADPPFVEFGARTAGGVTAFARVVLRNVGTAPVRVDTFSLVGRAPNDFATGAETCTAQKVAPGDYCTIDVRFLPHTVGNFAVSLRLRLADDDRAYVTLVGTGGAASGGRVEVIEYYNAALDHFFISSLAPDIVANDTGANAGWMRTGRTFPAFPSTLPTVGANGADAGRLRADGSLRAVPGASPVCRYYIPPKLGDSHFYSASPAECAEVGAKFATFTLEAPDVMYAYLPEPVSGACPAASIAVYRVWNQRADSNHRYTADLAVRDAMVAKGYVAEGYGPDGVAVCAPI